MKNDEYCEHSGVYKHSRLYLNKQMTNNEMPVQSELIRHSSFALFIIRIISHSYGFLVFYNTVH